MTFTEDILGDIYSLNATLNVIESISKRLKEQNIEDSLKSINDLKEEVYIAIRDGKTLEKKVSKEFKKELEENDKKGIEK